MTIGLCEKPSKEYIVAQYQRKSAHVSVKLRGHKMQTLLALKAAGIEGVSIVSAPDIPRLWEYIHELRQKHGLHIATKDRLSHGGLHCRYVLLTAVNVTE